MTFDCVVLDNSRQRSRFLDVFRPDLWWLQQWEPASNKGELGHVRAISGVTRRWLGMYGYATKVKVFHLLYVSVHENPCETDR